MATKPSTYLNWTDGAGSKVVQPPPAQLLSGWTAGEAPPFEYMNWLFWTTDLWIQWLDQNQNLGQPSSVNEQNARLIGGGAWSYVASTGTLSWSAAFNLSVPSIADANNQCAAGSIALADEQVAYVTANIPFSTTGTTVSGQNTISALAYQQGIVVGQTITGAGIPNGTTVTAISGSTVTMSANATASNSGAVFTFSSTGALSVQAASIASLVPASNTIILARRVGSICIVGVNSGQMLLRDGESKALLDTGYQSVFTGTAGQNIAAGQAVYMSTGTDGRTQGQLYLAEASGGSNGPVRVACIGIAVQTVTAGNSVLVVTDGIVNGFSSLVPGAIYYLDPTTPGGMTATQPTTVGQYILGIAVAQSTTTMRFAPGSGADPYLIPKPVYSVDTYGVTSESQFAAAITGCSAAGGGTIALMGSFTIAGSYTLPANTVLEGSRGATVLTVTGSLTLSNYSMVQDVVFVQGDSTPRNLVIIPTTCVGAIVRGCKFTISTSVASNCIYVQGVSTRILYCWFVGAVGGSGNAVYIQDGNDTFIESAVYG